MNGLAIKLEDHAMVSRFAESYHIITSANVTQKAEADRFFFFKYYVLIVIADQQYV